MPNSPTPQERDPKVDPQPGDTLRGMNQQRTVLLVGNSKEIAWWAPKENQPCIKYRRKNGDEDACTLSVWRKWASTATIVPLT